MIDSSFRTPYQRLIIDPLMKREMIQRLSPMAITALGLLFGLSVPLFLALQLPWWATIALVLSGFCDTLDGSLARLLGCSSPKGAVFDIVSDRMVEWAVLLGLFLYTPEGRGLMTIWMLGTAFLCVTTFLVVGIFHENRSEKSFHYSPGIMERSEAFIFFILMILAPNYFIPLAFLFGALTLLTAFTRIYQFFKY